MNEVGITKLALDLLSVPKALLGEGSLTRAARRRPVGDEPRAHAAPKVLPKASAPCPQRRLIPVAAAMRARSHFLHYKNTAE